MPSRFKTNSPASERFVVFPCAMHWLTASVWICEGGTVPAQKLREGLSLLLLVQEIGSRDHGEFVLGSGEVHPGSLFEFPAQFVAKVHLVAADGGRDVAFAQRVFLGNRSSSRVLQER